MRDEIRVGPMLGGLLLLALGAAACDTSVGEAEVDTQPSSAAQPSTGELPPGHPPLPGTPGGSMGVVPPPPPGSGTGATGLAWDVPAGWLEEEPRSSMRRAQYRVAGAAGDAECVVFYFGPGQGGDAMANALRWADQFSQPDGSDSRQVLKTEEIGLSAVGASGLLVEVTGTYSGGMAMGGQQPQASVGAMLLGAIVPGPDANWFFKCTGPESTLGDQREEFRAMIASLRPAAELT